jgi:hypothetical protein
MALDPRIALQGVQWQAPDILGAVRQGQDIRKNNMAMARQVAADEALFNYFNPPPGARPMNLSAADQGALGGFQDTFASMPAGVGRGPPITGQPPPSVGAPPASRMASRAAAAVASAVAPPAASAPPMANAMRAAPAADVRSTMMARMAPAGARPDISTLMPFADDPRVKAVLDQRAAEDERAAETSKVQKEEEQQAFVRTVAGVLANPDDAGLAAAAQQYPQFAQDIGRIAQLPLEQRSAALTSLMATLPGGEDFVKLFAPKPVQINRGGSIVTVDMNPLSPTYGQELRTDAVTPSPNRPQLDLVQREDGSFTIIDLGTGDVTDTDVVGRVPGSGAAGQDATRAVAAQSLLGTVDSLRGYYTDLDKLGGIVSTQRGGRANLMASAGASLPGRVLGRTFGSSEQTLRDNIQNAIPMIVADLKAVTGMSAQQMNSNVELQLFLRTVGDPSQSIESVMEALDRFERYVATVSGGEAPSAGGDQGGGQGPSQRRLSPREAAGLAPGTEFIGLDGSLMVRQ